MVKFPVIQKRLGCVTLNRLKAKQRSFKGDRTMFVRFAISVLLLVTAVTAHSAPIRVYFAGQIDTIYFL